MIRIHGDVVLITGVSSGIGKSIAAELPKLGYRVYGTSRTVTEAIRSNTSAAGGFLETIAGDVRSDASVQQVVRHVLDKEGRIDILINNAGIGIAGSIEDTSVAEALQQFDTNFFGAMRMCHAVLPVMREQKKGLIIQIGSVAGIISIPFQSMYSASKFALEAMIEALRMETREFGIRAVLVEPGDTRTGFTANRVSTSASNRNPAYQQHFEKAVKRMANDEQHGPEPIVVTNVVLKMLRKKNPPVRCVVGFSYKLICFLKRILPSRLVGMIVGSMY
jgi:short-subunit dehydrogenase